MSERPEELFKQYACVNCQDLITGIGIQCVECHNGNLRLCEECFMLGAELGDHKADHSYTFIGSKLVIPDEKEPASDVPQSSTVVSKYSTRQSTSTSTTRDTTSSPWSAEEEFTLLEKIESLGFGNWKSISKEMKTRTPKEVKEKYESRYVFGIIGQQTWSKPKLKGITDHTLETPLCQRLQELAPLKMTKKLKAELGYDPIPDEYDNEPDDPEQEITLNVDVEIKHGDSEAQKFWKWDTLLSFCDQMKKKDKQKLLLRDHQILRAITAATKSLDRSIAVVKELMPISIDNHITAYTKKMRDTLNPFTKNYTPQELDTLLLYLVGKKAVTLGLKEVAEEQRKGVTDENGKKGNHSLQTIRLNQQRRSLRKRNIETITLEDDDDETSCETKKGQVEKGESDKSKEGLNGAKRMLTNVIVANEKGQVVVNP